MAWHNNGERRWHFIGNANASEVPYLRLRINQIAATRSAHAACMGLESTRKVSMQAAWGNFSCAKCPCRLHGEISRARSVRAACMGIFLVREVSVQAAWGNFSCAKCPCRLHGEISRAQSVRAACMGLESTRKVSMRRAVVALLRI